MSVKKTVLVVGGGGAGARLARALSEKLDISKYDLLLISSHPFYIHYPAGLRLLVTSTGALEDRVLIPYDKLFVNGNGKFKHGTVSAIEAKKNTKAGGVVVLETGETVNYDVLALAPGSHWESFLTFPSNGDGQIRNHIDTWRTKFKEANKVVIAGGGAVGIELAGELRDFYPEKEITIVHGGRQLLNAAYPIKFRKDLEKRMRSSRVKLILDDYIDEFPASSTRKGTSLDADLVVAARGPRPNSEFIADSLGSDSVTDSGFVKIKRTMQLQAYPNIFALGDIIDFPEQKQVTKYPGHADIVAANIVSLLSDMKPTKEYTGTIELIFITNGRRGGAGYAKVLWGLTFGNIFASSMKSKDLFIGFTRKSLGLAS